MTGHNWVPNIPHFDDLAPAELAVLAANVEALAALPDDALSGEFGRHSYDALELAATVCSATAAAHLLTREAYVQSPSIHQDRNYEGDPVSVLTRAAKQAKDCECTIVLPLLHAALGSPIPESGSGVVTERDWLHRLLAAAVEAGLLEEEKKAEIINTLVISGGYAVDPVDMRQIVTHEIAQWTRALEEADRSDLLIEMQFSKKRENRIHN